jgi:hypothetical protein
MILLKKMLAMSVIAVMLLVLLIAGRHASTPPAPRTLVISVKPDLAYPTKVTKGEALRIARRFLGQGFPDLECTGIAQAPLHDGIECYRSVLTSKIKPTTIAEYISNSALPGGGRVVILPGRAFKGQLLVDAHTGHIAEFSVDDRTSHCNQGNYVRVTKVLTPAQALTEAKGYISRSGVSANNIEVLLTDVMLRQYDNQYSRYELRLARFAAIPYLGKVELPEWFWITLDAESGALVEYRRYSYPTDLKCAPPTLSADQALDMIRNKFGQRSIPGPAKTNLMIYRGYGARSQKPALVWHIIYPPASEEQVQEACVDAHTGEMYLVSHF